MVTIKKEETEDNIYTEEQFYIRGSDCSYFIDFIQGIYKSLYRYPDMIDQLYLYFEKNSNNKNIICLRLRNREGLVLYSSKTEIEKGIPRTYVKLERVEGEKGFELAKKTARNVSSFFKISAHTDTYLESNMDFVYTFDYKRKKIKMMNRDTVGKTLKIKNKKVG